MGLFVRTLVGVACGVVLASASPACVAPPLDGCHQRLVESLGCCPMCDVECRGAVDAACADDESHVAALADEGVATSSDDDGNGSDETEGPI